MAGVGVEKMSVSFDLQLGQDIRQSADAQGRSVSAWLAEAARDRLYKEALGEAMQEWQRVHGPLSAEELDEAGRTLDRAAKRRRSGAA
jgi:hypothetical protein